MNKSLIEKLTVFAFAGLMGAAGSASARPWDREPIQPSREGRPPVGSLRSEVMLQVAHDGRGETGGVERTFRAEPRAERQRPDSDLGQASHFVMPIKKDITLRVEGGDHREGAPPAKLAHGTRVAEPAEARAYPGRHERQAPPLPIKMDILLKVSGGGEAGMGETQGIDDPKLARHADTSSASRPETSRDARVYPGRHENPPSVPEMFMKVQRRPSAHGDQAGDKDAP